eukprot:TRINITY_DN6072_c0_g1_i1.p1 TRINITY_DN6072_c0_g1~~TRINITY_DN6072_c0_g1_i1.p1  ORF type:complete len:491 (-),score=98.56 TRINITY_DN6072_c0_g1_i1:142-1614(-)
MSAELWKSVPDGVIRSIPISGVATDVFRLRPMSTASSQSPVKIVFIPGNPGILDFYVPYLRQLHSVFMNHDVFAVGHLGHNTVNRGSSQLFNLEQQIQHKISFLQSIVDEDASSRFILIGHSIGAYMCLKVMERSTDIRVLRSLLLFPTIEEMAKQRNRLFGLMFVRGIRHILALIAHFLGIFLPTILKLLVMRLMGIEGNSAQAAMQLMNFTTVNNILYLAGTEFAQVRALDKHLVKKNLAKLIFYYGQDDHWAPLRLFYQMRSRFPEAADSILLDQLNIPHAFPVSHNYQCASISAALLADVIPFVPRECGTIENELLVSYPATYKHVDFGAMGHEAVSMALRVGALAEHLQFRNKQLLDMQKSLVEVRQQVAHLLVQKALPNASAAARMQEQNEKHLMQSEYPSAPATPNRVADSQQIHIEFPTSSRDFKAVSSIIPHYQSEDDVTSEISVARTASFEMLSTTVSETPSRVESRTDLKYAESSEPHH